eukprot:gene4408-3207_t
MSSLNSIRVRDLIRSVRQCKTPSEEQALVNRERAHIRESMKDGSPYNRTRNMLKLMYLSMIGYSTSFGQLEVVNLLAQRDFSGKRTGYLSLPIMVDEKDEVLTLVENHMKADMGGENPLLRAVALNAAANIASEDMSKDILEDVLKLVRNYNPYLRKKACLCGLRMVRKVPEFSDYFLEELDSMFDDRFSSSLLCSLALANYCLQTEQGKPFMDRYRTLTSAAVRQLRSLLNQSRICDSTIGMITDPFLQVKLLEFMRIVGRGNAEVSEQLHDCLASVMSQTNGDKNVSNAVRYECTRTIQAIKSDQTLRQLGITTMGRMLETKSNNFRYIALESLSHFAAMDPSSVQVHQNVILDSIKEPDPSIQTKSLDLIIELITESNIRQLVPDLLEFLRVSTGDIKERVAMHLCRALEEKSPSDEWRIDVSIKVLKAGKKFVPHSFAFGLIALISRQPEEVQLRAAMTLWEEISQPLDAVGHSREALLLCSLWCVGEYIQGLTKKKELPVERVVQAAIDVTLGTIVKKVKLYGLTSIMKIASSSPTVKPAALKAFGCLVTSLECEQQQRALEYATLLNKFPDTAAFCFGPMPPMAALSEEPLPIAVVSQQEVRAVDQILDDLFGPSGIPDTPLEPESTGPHAQFQDPNGDLLALDTPQDDSSEYAKVKDFADLSISVAAHTVENIIHARVRITSRINVVMRNLQFQAAVPRSCTITLGSLSSKEISPMGELFQNAEITVGSNNKNPRTLMMKVKLLYTVEGEQREQLVEINYQTGSRPASEFTKREIHTSASSTLITLWTKLQKYIYFILFVVVVAIVCRNNIG